MRLMTEIWDLLKSVLVDILLAAWLLNPTGSTKEAGTEQLKHHCTRTLTPPVLSPEPLGTYFPRQSVPFVLPHMREARASGPSPSLQARPRETQATSHLLLTAVPAEDLN